MMRQRLPTSPWAIVMALTLGPLASATAAPPAIFPPQAELPQVIQGEEGRVLIAAGDRLYTEPLGRDAAERYYLLRPGPALTAPNTRRTRTRGSIFLGEATLLHNGNPAVLMVEQARREIRPGDYLLATEDASENQDG